MFSERFHRTRAVLVVSTALALTDACTAETSAANPTTYELTCDTLLNSIPMKEGLEYTIKVKSREGKITLQRFANDIFINGDGDGKNALRPDEFQSVPLDKRTKVDLSRNATGVTRATVLCK